MPLCAFLPPFLFLECFFLGSGGMVIVPFHVRYGHYNRSIKGPHLGSFLSILHSHVILFKFAPQ